MNLIFIGAPGAGKGTQARKVADQFKVVHVATGDIFRQAIQQKTADGQRAEEYLKAGTLVPDDLVNRIVRERLKAPDMDRGFVLDGFPRTVLQAQALDKFLGEMGRTVGAVLYIDLSEEELVRRLSNRRTCSQCGAIYHLIYQPPPTRDQCPCGGTLVQRKDDAPETIRKRIGVFHEQTKPLIAYYQGSRAFYTINGSQSIDQVAKSILESLSSLDGQKKV